MFLSSNSCIFFSFCFKDSGTGWSTWSSYGPCNNDCIKERTRFCMDPTNHHNCPNPTSTERLYWGVDVGKKDCVKDATECYG